MKRCRICKKRKPRKAGFHMDKRNGKRMRRCRACVFTRPNEAHHQIPKGRPLVVRWPS